MRNYILFMILTTFSAQAGLARVDALSMIETGNNDAAIGRAGEVSRYQIKPWIWRQYSRSYSYTDRQTSRQVAEKHLKVLQSSFVSRARREPTNFDLYVLWNAGPTYYAKVGFSKTRVHPIIRERAQRYANLCQPSVQTIAKAAPQKTAPEAKRPQVAKQAVQSHAPASAGVPWPEFAARPGPSLQNPMFQVMPLTTRPIPSISAQQAIFAIGGVKAD